MARFIALFHLLDQFLHLINGRDEASIDIRETFKHRIRLYIAALGTTLKANRCLK